MKMKILGLLLVLVVAVGMLAGCGSADKDTTNEASSTADAVSTTNETTGTADVVTTASLVSDADALVKAMGSEGKFIACILNDVTTDKELVFEGEFHDKDDNTKALYHKLALYAQDENHKVTARYTLTAPKLTIKSPNAKIQGGTFKGDVYVEANGFTLQDATIDGNIYFSKQEYKDSCNIMTEEGKVGTVTGKMEVK